MSSELAAVLQLAALVGALALAYRPLGDYMAAVYRSGEPPARRAVDLPLHRRRSGRPRCAGPPICAGCWPSPRVSVLFLYLLQRAPGRAAAVARLLVDRPGAGVQHRRVLRLQHQLAVVRGRAGHGPRRPDRRARGAELPLRRRRHRGGHRPGPRLRPLPHRRARQLLGRPGARHRPRPDPDRGDRRDRAGGVRRDPELRRHPRGRAAHRRQPPGERRRGRLPGGHQGDSAPTAAASSTPTPPTRSRTRTPSPTSSRSS